MHNGHAFGFDGNILACINLEDGKRKWKGGRYGNGQLVAGRPGRAAGAVGGWRAGAGVGHPDQFTEIATARAQQQTWNHPVLVGGVLLIRNGEEMAAFRLSLGQLTRVLLLEGV